MSRHNRIYWAFQVAGWSIYCLVYGFIYLTMRSKPQPFFFQQLITHVILGLVLTHVMRCTIQRLNILKLPFKRQVPGLILISMVFSFLIGVCIVATEKVLDLQTENSKNYHFLNIAVHFAFSYFHFIIVWNLIYFTYHYVEKTKQQQIDHAKLESLLKELEIKTLKSHINPQFIFNSLNSIRGLVVEEPVHARVAITQLSNILRSSMQVDKAEKTLLEKELSIVKDYLALEMVRFDNRLQVTYDIEEDTLDQPVPAMILQILVENALKYGNATDNISLQIISVDNDSHHTLTVKSSGNLQTYTYGEKEKIQQIRSRLSALYGRAASLTLTQTDDGKIIEATVSVPI